jgi:protein-S-isoprenylcysteine O-methyltransferase Ste14
MLTAPQKSVVLVILQFTLIGLLFFSTAEFTISAIVLLLLSASLLLVAWAIFAMRQSKLRISPVPADKAKLITCGPYRFIRHPMYTAILLGAAGLLNGYFSWIRLGMAITLALILIIKLFWEEKMLTEKFPDYTVYKTNTWHLFPYVF